MQTSHPPKFYVTDPELPVVTISFIDQKKSAKLASPDGIQGSVVIDSIDKILEADHMFNYTCNPQECIRFELLRLVKALRIISIINNGIF